MLQPSLFRLFVYRYNAHLPDAMQNVNGCINPRVAERLSVQPPSAYMVQTYLEKICDEHQVDWKPKVPLKADEIANPMSAPSGYSVQVGGGSGINASEFVEGGLPANGGSGGASAPPLSPSSYGNLPVAPNSSQQQKQQQSAYVPVLPKPASSAAVPSKIDDIEEEDIFIPGAPTTAPGGPVKLLMMIVMKRVEEEEERKELVLELRVQENNQKMMSMEEAVVVVETSRMMI